MIGSRDKFWRRLSGPKLLKLIVAVSAMAIAYEGMSQGVMGAVNVAPEYGVRLYPYFNHVVFSANKLTTFHSAVWALQIRMGKSCAHHCKEELLPSTMPAL